MHHSHDASAELTGFDALSARERQVIAMATVGLVDKQIAHELDLSVHTLRTYWERIKTKVGDAPRAALVGAYVASELRKYSPGATVLPECGLMIDLESHMVTASKQVSEEHGFEPETVHSLEEYMALIHPQDVQGVGEIIAELSKGGQKIVHFTCRCLALNRVRRLSYMFCAKPEEDGTLKKICGFRTDDRDVSDDTFGRVLVGFSERWLDEDEAWCDDEMRTILGYSPDDEPSLSLLLERVHPDDRVDFLKVRDRLKESDGERIEATVRIVHPGGKVVPVKFVWRGASHDDGRMKVTTTATAELSNIQ